MIRLLLIVLVAGMAACTPKKEATVDAAPLAPAEFQKALTETPGAVLVDVRTPEEFQEGKIAQSTNINFNTPDFADQFNSWDKSKPLFVYCKKGGRSGKATAILREKGFTVTDLAGGLTAWESAGLPVEKP